MKKRLPKLLVSLGLALVLTSCDDEIVNLPLDANNPIVTVDEDPNGQVTTNQKEEIYNSVEDSIDRNQVQLNNILYDLAENVYLTDEFKPSDEVFAERWHDIIMENTTNSSYVTDHVFDEFKFALSLIQDRYEIKTSTGATDLASIKASSFKGVVTPEDDYEDVFKLDYSDYVERYLKPQIYRQYLTARYIYDQSYSSIGTTNARNVTAVKITDRTDKPGEAIKLINAFIRDFINNPAASAEDTDLKHLTTLWKGVDLSAEDQAWLTTNGLTTLASQIEEEISKITSSEYTTDKDLEAEYTGNYTYPVSWGQELAERELAVSTIYYEDTYLRSDGIEDIPSALADRVFSTNYNTDVAAVEAGTRIDNSWIITHTDGTMYRYTKAPVSQSSGASSIVYYDSSSSSYYIVQVHTIVTTSLLTKNANDSEEQAKYKFDLAMDAAYMMAEQSSYRTSAITWYLTHNSIDYSDPDFYDYIDSNYPDVFED